MEIRGLVVNDTFKMSKILKKMGLKMEVKGKTQEQLGSELILSAFENIHMAQEEVNDFLGDLVGISGDDFGKLPFEEGVTVIEQFKNIPGLDRFFKQANQLTK
jgi:hypothetical protein